MRNNLLLLVIFFSCQSVPKVPGFDKDIWLKAEPCSSERVKMAELLVENEEALLSATQTDIEALLGPAPRHELFNRNEKFFYYPIRVDCEEGENQSLFIRFDALARAKEVIIVFD